MKLLAISLATATFLTGCGGDGAENETPATTKPSPSEAPSEPAGAVSAPPVEDSAALRDSLLEIAEANVTDDPGEGFQASYGIFEAWQEAYPDLGISGYAVEPGPDSISVYSNTQNSKEVAGPENPHVMAFAILDAQGTCSGGVMVGYPAPSTFEPVEMTGEEQPCNPLAVAAAGGYETFG